MRFVIGPPPDSPDFAPERDGWKRVRLPSPGQLMVVGSALGIPLGGLMIWGWRSVSAHPPDLRFQLPGLGWAAAIVAPILLLLIGLLLFGGLIVVHELLHALASPGLGLSSKTILGIWPSRMMPYADYQGAIPCWRCHVVALAPFVLLSLLPWAVSFAIGQASIFWFAVSLLNALVCGGDVLMGLAIAAQVPLDAMVRNKGWQAWWLPRRGEPG